jgi:hypothetical protein
LRHLHINPNHFSFPGRQSLRRVVFHEQHHFALARRPLRCAAKPAAAARAVGPVAAARAAGPVAAARAAGPAASAAAAPGVKFSGTRGEPRRKVQQAWLLIYGACVLGQRLGYARREAILVVGHEFVNQGREVREELCGGKFRPSSCCSRAPPPPAARCSWCRVGPGRPPRSGPPPSRGFCGRPPEQG